MRTNNTDYYFVRDHLGSVRLVLDSQCNIVEQYEYSTYGELTIRNASDQIITESAIGNRHTYTGREWDDALGLYYYRARWYDPTIRRFTQKDIIHFTNRYIYVENNPVNYIDPMGRDIWIETQKGGWNHKVVWFDNYDGTATGYDLGPGKKYDIYPGERELELPWDKSGLVEKRTKSVSELINNYDEYSGLFVYYERYYLSEEWTKRGKKWAEERYKNQDYSYYFPFTQCWTFVEDAKTASGYNPYDLNSNWEEPPGGLINILKRKKNQ